MIDKGDSGPDGLQKGVLGSVTFTSPSPKYQTPGGPQLGPTSGRLCWTLVACVRPNLLMQRDRGCAAIEKVRPSKQNTSRQPNRIHHDGTKCESRAILSGAGGRASRGRIRTPLPGSNAPGGIVSGKRRTKDGKWRVLQRCCKISTSLHQIVELRMCALSHHIREQRKWWERVKGEAAMEKWRGDLLKTEGASSASKRLTATMVKFWYVCTPPPFLLDIQVDYVLGEVHGYASLRDPETGIEV